MGKPVTLTLLNTVLEITRISSTPNNDIGIVPLEYSKFSRGDSHKNIPYLFISRQNIKFCRQLCHLYQQSI